jgi:hypothetical protein
MDWIETLFGVSPDGGDGTTEAAIIFACVVVLGAVIVMRSPGLRRRIGGLFEPRRSS